MIFEIKTMMHYQRCLMGGGDMVMDWIWKLCNRTLRMVLCLKTRSVLGVPIYRGKGERTECRNY